jgi:hypothetical protein
MKGRQNSGHNLGSWAQGHCALRRPKCFARPPLPAIPSMMDKRFSILGKVADRKVLPRNAVSERPRPVGFGKLSIVWSGLLRAMRKYLCVVDETQIASFFLHVFVVTLPLSCALAEPLRGETGAANLDPFHGDEPMKQTWGQSKILRSKLSTGTTPEAFKVGKFTYIVPKAYIFNPNIIVRATYPEFKPVPKGNIDCIASALTGYDIT